MCASKHASRNIYTKKETFEQPLSFTATLPWPEYLYNNATLLIRLALQILGDKEYRNWDHKMSILVGVVELPTLPSLTSTSSSYSFSGSQDLFLMIYTKKSCINDLLKFTRVNVKREHSFIFSNFFFF